MHAAGLLPTAKTAYILVRAAVNSGRMDTAAAYLARMRAEGVHIKPSTLQLIMDGQRREAQGQAAMAAAAAEAADRQRNNVH